MLNPGLKDTIASLPLPTGASTEAKQDTIIAALNSLGATTTGITPGRKVVSVTGTAIVLGSATCKEVTITALTSNVDVVVIGNASVVFTLATRTGTILYPGDSFVVAIDNISKLYVNGTSADGVTFNYTT